MLTSHYRNLHTAKPLLKRRASQYDTAVVSSSLGGSSRPSLTSVANNARLLVAMII